MKYGSDDLYQLIHALSPSEKRYVSIRNSSDPSALYVQLYVLMDEQEAYAEDRILATLRQADGNVNLAMLKRYLERYLVGVLCDYHGAGNDAWQHYQAVFAARFLHEKGLNRTVARLLRSARDASGKAENYIQMLAANRVELTFSHDLPDDDIPAHQFHLYEEARTTIALIAIDTEYVYLQSIMQRMMREVAPGMPGPHRDTLRSLLDSPFVRDDAPKTTRQQLTYTSIRSRIHALLGEVDLALEYSERNVATWESLPAHLEQSIVSYSGALNNLFSRAVQAQRFDLLQGIRQKIAILPARSHEMKLFMFQCLTQLDLMLVYVAADYCVLRDVVSRFEQASPEYERYTPPYMLRSIWVNIGQLLMLTGEWDHALRYINRVLNDTVVRDGFVRMCRILQLIVHYELGNDRVIESIRRSLKRSARTAADSTPLEADLADMVWRLMQLTPDSEKRTLLFRTFSDTYTNELASGTALNGMVPYALTRWIQRNDTTPAS